MGHINDMSSYSASESGLFKSNSTDPFYIALLANGDIAIVHFDNKSQNSIHGSKKPLIIGNFKDEDETKILQKIQNFQNLETVKTSIAKTFNKIEFNSSDKNISERIKNIGYANIKINTEGIDSIFKINEDKYVIFLQEDLIFGATFDKDNNPNLSELGNY